MVTPQFNIVTDDPNRQGFPVLQRLPLETRPLRPQVVDAPRQASLLAQISAIFQQRDFRFNSVKVIEQISRHEPDRTRIERTLANDHRRRGSAPTAGSVARNHGKDTLHAPDAGAPWVVVEFRAPPYPMEEFVFAFDAVGDHSGDARADRLYAAMLAILEEHGLDHTWSAMVVMKRPTEDECHPQHWLRIKTAWSDSYNDRIVQELTVRARRIFHNMNVESTTRSLRMRRNEEF